MDLLGAFFWARNHRIDNDIMPFRCGNAIKLRARLPNLPVAAHLFAPFKLIKRAIDSNQIGGICRQGSGAFPPPGRFLHNMIGNDVV